MSNKNIRIIGVASDLGANIAGSRLGPEALRISGLNQKLCDLGFQTLDIGNIRPKENQDNHSKTDLIYSINLELKQKCLSALENNAIPLVLGGDHSLAIGSIAASLSNNPNTGIIWIDTHADINTPDSSPTQNIHGMPVATLMRDGFESYNQLIEETLPTKNIAYIGLRDLDQHEKETLKKLNIKFFTMRDVDEFGIQGVFKATKKHLINHVDNIHISFDLDVMDPQQVPGVSTPVPAGLTLREAHLLLELLHETGKITACDFVELNPMNDIAGKSAKICIDLIGSAFGSSII